MVVVACSAAVGQGLCVLGGRRTWSWWAPGAGFAALLAIAGVLIRTPGRSAAAVAGIAVATAASLASRDVRRALADAMADSVPVTLRTVLASIEPSLAYGDTGILGDGINN